MSKVTRCSRCGGNIVEPAYEGDGAYAVAPMCTCGQPNNKSGHGSGYYDCEEDRVVVASFNIDEE